MLVNLGFQRFRGFKAFSARIEPLTAFLGPNSSGKTTALRAIRLACDALAMAVESEYPARLVRDGERKGRIIVTDGLLIRDHNRLMPLADWRALFVDQVTGENLEIEISLSFAASDPIQSLWVHVVCARNEQLKLSVYVESSEAWSQVEAFPRKSSRINQWLSDFLRARAPVAVFVPPFYGTVLAEEHRAKVVIDRLLGSGDQSHVVRNLVAGLDGDRFAQLNSFLRDTLGAELTYRTSGDALQSESPIVVRFRDTNGEIELSAAGAGLVNLVSLHAALSRWRHASAERNVIFLLDEPEAHLHPRLQAESAERLGKLVTRDFGAQLVLATHSVDILNRLAMMKDTLLLRCDRTADPSVVELSSDSALFDDLSGWADLTPYTAINFLASRRIIFCEGDDERRLLPRLAELRFRNDRARLAEYRRWALVQLVGAGNDKLADLLARLINHDVVASRGQHGAFKMLVVLDRDFTRTPGFTETSLGEERSRRIDATTKVWSMYSLESLFLDPPVLARWVRAFAGSATPDDLDEKIGRATEAANTDNVLCSYASDRLLPHVLKTELKDNEGKVITGDRKLIRANELAREIVTRDPAIWQRGKDRGRAVLGRVRESIGLPRRNQFPTNIIDLLLKTDLNEIGDAEAAIPSEVRELLDRMAPSHLVKMLMGHT